MPDQAKKSHTRVNSSLTSTVEKKVLLWMAARMPKWVTPDRLTAIGFLGSLMIFAGYLLTLVSSGFLWLSNLGFFVQWFGDSLDGNLARYRKIERPRYGYFVDHIMDTASIVLIFIGLGISPYVRLDLAMIACAGYLTLSVYVYLATQTNGIFRLSYAGFGPTEARLLAVLGNTLVYFTGNPRFQLGWWPVSLTVYDWIAVGFSILAGLVFIASAVATAVELDRVDDPKTSTLVRK